MDPETAEVQGPETPEAPVADVSTGETVGLDEDVSTPAASTVDQEETLPVGGSEPDAEAAAEAPVAPDAGTDPDAAPEVPVTDAPDAPLPDAPEEPAVQEEPDVPDAPAAPGDEGGRGAEADAAAPTLVAGSPSSGQDRPHGRHEATGDVPVTPAVTSSDASGGWAKLGRAMRPSVTRSQLLAGLLCALLGFALAVQVSQTQEEQLSSLRQSDLVRLLDDVTQRANDLESRVEGLQDTRDELSSGSGQQRAALELAQQQAQTQGILSGRLPAEGPGITLTITEADKRIPASKLFNILEELRNAGVEVVEVNGVRLVTSTYFEETSRGMVVDGQKISSPYEWQAIGDPSTLETALEIPGGAMSSVRNEGATPKITQQDLITISSTREPEAPEFATPVPAEGGD
ncbi:hypothetical protein DLJ96_03005 [Actinotalea fermentans ATCC 43279 = JCM 9966 = DSM 3133]|nr:hypothetical protein DLJ96_03005 [Actinotalea fermentans ATCC 43279 = JCM 9966 = DSM 3133]